MSAAAWSATRVDRPTTSDASGASVVAVLPFSVNGGADVQYLADGLVDLLSLRLDASGTSRPVASRAILSRFGGRTAFGESDAARAAAEARSSLGATRIVIGAVTQVGESLELAARLVAANGTLITVATAHANTERDLPAAVDDLARGVLAAMAGHRIELTSATTPSLDALKSFMAGEREFREGRFDAAIVNYRSAIRADTTFGRAYARLSAALSEATNVQARDASAMAVAARRFADHLPSVERLLVLGHAEFYAGSAQAAEQYFRAATSAAPEDVEAWLGLGESIFHGNPIDGRPMGAARSAFARALALDPGNPTALEHLSPLDAWDRNTDSLIRRTVQLNPEARGDVRGREIVALATFATGDSATKTRLIDELATVAPRDAWRIAWTTAHYARAYSEAERILAGIGKRLVPSRRRGLVTVARAHFLAAAGRVPAAYALLDSARADAPVEALCTRAQFVLLLDPSRVRSGEREAVVRDLRAWDGRLADPDAWFEEEFEEDGPSIRAYYLARLGAAPAGPYAPPSMVPALLAASNGDYESAIRIAQNSGARYVRMRRSLRFNRGLDRLLIGQWLLATGNATDAAQWLSSIPEDRGYDVLLIERAGLLGRMALAAARHDPPATEAEPITHFP
jgi:tetratricopeptide (TPR) repeat protein